MQTERKTLENISQAVYNRTMPTPPPIQKKQSRTVGCQTYLVENEIDHTANMIISKLNHQIRDIDKIYSKFKLDTEGQDVVDPLREPYHIKSLYMTTKCVQDHLNNLRNIHTTYSIQCNKQKDKYKKVVKTLQMNMDQLKNKNEERNRVIDQQDKKIRELKDELRERLSPGDRQKAYERLFEWKAAEVI